MIAGWPRMAAVIVLATALAATAPGQTEPASREAGDTTGATATNPSALDDPWSAVEPKSPEEQSRTLQRRSTGRASPLLAGKSEQDGQSMIRTLGALAGVVGLIVLLAWGYRAAAGGRLSLLRKLRRPGLIEVVSKTSLSARQSLCLVRIGPRLVLIGQSPDDLRALDVIDNADLAARLLGEAARERAGSSQAEFRDCLEREAKGYQIEDPELDERISPEALRIAGVQRGLRDAIRRIRGAVGQA
jgi:flagellar biogenesis protein FliO